MMKRYLGLVMLIVLMSLTSCTSESAEDYAENGRYFMQWDSYLGYSTEENPVLNLAYIEVGKTADRVNPDIKKLTLISNQDEINVEKFTISQGDSGKGYALDTLFLELPKLAVGVYRVTDLKITKEDETEVIHNIGCWNIDVRGNLSSSISYGRISLGSNLFERYFAEIKNQSNEEISVSSLDFHLETKNPTILISSSSNFDEALLSEERLIPASQMRFFSFQFISDDEEDTKDDFIAIRPFLLFTQFGEEHCAVMDTTYYSPVYTDEEIFHLLGRF